MLYHFLLYQKMNQLYIYIHPLFFEFPSHLGYHRQLSGVFCAVQYILTSYLFYTSQGLYVYPSLPIHNIPLPFPAWYLCLFSTSVPLCCKYVHLHHFLWIPYIYVLIYNICFFLSDLLLYDSVQDCPHLYKFLKMYLSQDLLDPKIIILSKL